MNGADQLRLLLEPQSLSLRTRADEGSDVRPAAVELWRSTLRKQTPFCSKEHGMPAINRALVGPF